MREVAEETGLRVRVVRHAGYVELPAPGGGVYGVDDFVCALVTGESSEPIAGDDATQARWVGLNEFTSLPTAPNLVDTLRDWGVLPA